MSSDSITVGPTGAICPVISVVFRLEAGDSFSFMFDWLENTGAAHQTRQNITRFNSDASVQITDLFLPGDKKHPSSLMSILFWIHSLIYSCLCL